VHNRKEWTCHSQLHVTSALISESVARLLQGFILDKKIGVGQKKRIENAKILVANTPMDTDKIKMYGARVKTDSMAKVADIELAEKAKMKEKCDKIIAQGINVFINRQLIYNYPEEIFGDAGVMSIEHAGALLSVLAFATSCAPFAELTVPQCDSMHTVAELRSHAHTMVAPELHSGSNFQDMQTLRASSAWRSCLARRLPPRLRTPIRSASARAS
jgi:TCP-1/cpn60 chaperonin family